MSVDEFIIHLLGQNKSCMIHARFDGEDVESDFEQYLLKELETANFKNKE